MRAGAMDEVLRVSDAGDIVGISAEDSALAYRRYAPLGIWQRRNWRLLRTHSWQNQVEFKMSDALLYIRVVEKAMDAFLKG